jgi:bifunctional non-homologous end joining protein LigD
MLAKEVQNAFDDDNWIFEIKWDGYRAIAEITANDVKFYSRNGISFKNSYPAIFDELKKIKQKIVLDGEIVVLNKDGKSDFQKLQHYGENPEYPLCYYVFDILFLNTKDICDQPLIERKKLLKKILKETDVIKYSDHIVGEGISFFKAAQKKDLEGIMAKKADSNYYKGKRSSEWLKIKNHHSQEAIIAGFTEPTGARKYFGALVLAIKDGDKLKYVGHTGSGFTEKTLKETYNLLKPLIKKISPFVEQVKTNSPVTWVQPKYVCEIKFTEWTTDHKMRHPIFLQIRKDKNINEVTMAAIKPIEKESKPATKKATSSKNIKKEKPAGKTNNDELTFGKIKVKTSNVSKIYFPKEKITKGMVIDYYQQIADYILPYLQDRPESLKRNPNGINDPGFFHKDAGVDAPSWIKSKKIYSESAKKDIDYIICNDKATLAYLNNLGCIELNPWNSTIKTLDNPDYMIIDIDPSEKNNFDQVVETANAFKELLDKAGAESFCKTSGASGLHIYVPMGKKYSYDQTKDFAHLLCTFVSEKFPSFTTLERNLQKRGSKKIYLDYLQNRRGQTLACVYSLRPRAGATVSTPLQWKEVKKGLRPSEFTITTIFERLKKIGDLFKGVFGKNVDLEKALDNISK